MLCLFLALYQNKNKVPSQMMQQKTLLRTYVTVWDRWSHILRCTCYNKWPANLGCLLSFSSSARYFWGALSLCLQKKYTDLLMYFLNKMYQHACLQGKDLPIHFQSVAYTILKNEILQKGQVVITVLISKWFKMRTERVSFWERGSWTWRRSSRRGNRPRPHWT